MSNGILLFYAIFTPEASQYFHIDSNAILTATQSRKQRVARESPEISRFTDGCNWALSLERLKYLHSIYTWLEQRGRWDAGLEARNLLEVAAKLDQRSGAEAVGVND